jgi:DNA-binding response OmpR family regulator
LPLLGSAGYAARSVNEQGALLAIEEEHPLLLIVGGTANLDLYRACRCAGTAPILAIVPDVDEECALAAFAVGVDDYQSGRISHREIVVRVGALLRSLRRPSPSAQSAW